VTLFGKRWLYELSPVGTTSVSWRLSSPTRNTDTVSLPALVTNSQRRSWLSCTDVQCVIDRKCSSLSIGPYAYGMALNLYTLVAHVGV
jgi:hypothetical protein